MHSSSRDEILGTAYGDHDLVVFLEGVGVADPEVILGDPLFSPRSRTDQGTTSRLRRPVTPAQGVEGRADRALEGHSPGQHISTPGRLGSGLLRTGDGRLRLT